MLIKLYNFGPISKFEFDLEKDFHLIVGQNNVGKSYAITAVYLILKAVLSSHISPRIFFDAHERYHFNYENESHKNDKTLERISDLKNKKEIKFDDEVENSLIEYLSFGFLQSLNESLKNSFNSIDNLSNQFVSNDFSIQIVLKEFTIHIGI